MFKVTQTRSGLATISLVSNAFKGAPSFASCKAKKGKAVSAAVSSKTLQLLHSSAHGKFRTKGKYAAATVRGTIWTIADRCDGTLTHAIKDSVTVSDFVRHKTIILRPATATWQRRRSSSRAPVFFFRKTAPAHRLTRSGVVGAVGKGAYAKTWGPLGRRDRI